MGRDPFLFPDAPRLKAVSESVEWRRLLHYRKPFLRSTRSDIDDPSFFLSSEGAKDAEAELRATLEMFLSPEKANAPRGQLGQPTACAFPARLAFLKRVLGTDFETGLPKIAECTAYAEWSQGIRARGVSLVFSSAYPNNPASMFGHTFLRLDRSNGMDLLSYGVNFSATISTDENPFKYAIWGLLGGYTGQYDLSPYYRKVNEYAFSESRDLWEYRLSLSEEEVAQLVRHVWELFVQGGLDYYFLDENCSFQILTALEGVKPDWKLSEGFLLSVLPVETVKKVTNVSGAVVETVYRPSLRNQMVSHLARLSPEEKKDLGTLFDGKETNLAAASTGTLDALISVLAYEKERDGKKEARSALQRTVLLERSRRGKVESSPEEAPIAERPDLSHGSSRISASGGSVGGDSALGLSLYAFRHDFLDRTPSYNLFSEVRLFGFRGEKLEKRDFRFEQADLIAMASMAPRSKFDSQKSWRLSVDWSRLSEAPEGSAGTWRASGGYGLGMNLLSPRNLGYALASAELEKSGIFHHGFRFSPGLDIGMILNPVAERYFLQARILPSWDAAAARHERRFRFRGELLQSFWLSRELDLRFSLSVERSQLSQKEWLPRAQAQLGWRF